MYQLHDINPDVMRSELAFRRERLAGEHHSAAGLNRWLRARRQARPAQSR